MSDLTDEIKRNFFQAAVVSVLLYGCTTWTLTKRMEKKLDGNYTRILQVVLNKSKRQLSAKQQLYGHHMEVRPDRWNKTQFFPRSGRISTTTWMDHVDAKKAYGEKAWRQLHRNSSSCIEQFLEATLHKTTTTRPPTTHHENYQS